VAQGVGPEFKSQYCNNFLKEHRISKIKVKSDELHILTVTKRKWKKQ
jgi:hypothetical protein